MFGSAFAELAFAELSELSVGKSVVVIIYMNDDTLTYPLSINKLAEFSMEINKMVEISTTR